MVTTSLLNLYWLGITVQLVMLNKRPFCLRLLLIFSLLTIDYPNFICRSRSRWLDLLIWIIPTYVFAWSLQGLNPRRVTVKIYIKIIQSFKYSFWKYYRKYRNDVLKLMLSKCILNRRIVNLQRIVLIAILATIANYQHLEWFFFCFKCYNIRLHVLGQIPTHQLCIPVLLQ